MGKGISNASALGTWEEGNRGHRATHQEGDRIESGNLARTELGVGSTLFSLCSARCGVAACLPGLCATGEGATLLAFGASTDAARGDRRVGAPPAIAPVGSNATGRLTLCFSLCKRPARVSPWGMPRPRARSRIRERTDGVRYSTRTRALAASPSALAVEWTFK